MMIVPAWAANEMPDVNQTGSISITLQDHGNPVPGGSLKLYPVAGVKVYNGFSFEFTQAFASCGYSLENLESGTLAQNLADFALENELPGQSLPVSEDGTAKAANLPLGLYLVVQNTTAEDYAAINPFLVTIPMHSGEKLVYDVDASPKVTLNTTDIPEDNPPLNPNPPHGPNLPQTGQLWWPVPVLAISGMLFVALGWKKRNYEKR